MSGRITMERRQIVLLILMCVIGLFVIRKYLPMLNLPTEGRLQSRLLELKSLQGDLGVARKMASDRNDVMMNLREMTDSYWISSNVSTRLEQEINSEFSSLCRRSQLSGMQKVDVLREKNGSVLQEITVSLDFKNITMKQFALFLETIRNSPNGRKFRWDYCKISPDNPRSPRGINCSLRFKILALNAETIELLNTGSAPEAASASVKNMGRKKTTSATGK